MNIFAIAALIDGIISLLLGLFVYLKGRRKAENQLFGLISLGLALWGIFYFLWQTTGDKAKAILFLQILCFGLLVASIALLSFTFYILNLIQKKGKILISYYLISFIITILGFSPLFIKELRPILIFPYWPKATLIFHFYLSWVLILAFYSLCLLLNSLKYLTGYRKAQIQYWLLAASIGTAGLCTNIPQWYGVAVYPYGNFVLFLYPLIITFAIFKYHLFEIKVILTELSVGVMGIVLLILPFVIKTTFSMRILMIGVFLLFCFIGYLLIRYTHRELKAKEILEEKVKERTKELEIAKNIAEERAKEIEKRKEDLEKFYKLTVGRELRMIELKKQIKELEEKMKEENQ